MTDTTQEASRRCYKKKRWIFTAIVVLMFTAGAVSGGGSDEGTHAGADPTTGGHA